MSEFFGSIIFIENNGTLIDSVLNDKSNLELYPCLHHRKLVSAMTVMKSRKDIRLIILSSMVSASKGEEELQKIRESYPELPVLYLNHSPTSYPQVDLSKFPNVFTLEKPTTFAELIGAFKEILKHEDRFDNIAPSPEEKDKELELKDDDYVPMRLEEFIQTSKSFFNIFIKLGANRFVKILNVGDPIDQEFIANYAKKGITHLYLPEPEQKAYIAFAEKVSAKVLQSSETTSTRKIKQIMGLGASISRSLAHSGIAPETLDYASSFMTQSISLIKSTRFKSETMVNFLRSLENNEHTTTVSFISGIIANELGFESSKSIKLVGIAALVHDIGLFDLAPNLVDDHEALELPEYQKIFEEHAKHGADILRASGNFDESLCIAVEQHHLRRRGTGHETKTNNVNIVTEIIGVSDDFYNYVVKGGVTKEKMHVFINIHLKNFSPQVEKAFMAMLTKKSKKSA